MKKIICLLTFSILLLIAACNDEKKPVESTKQVPVETKTKVIVVNPAQPVIVKEPAAKSTTITLDKNGVKVGTKKVEVVIRRDSSK